jgi:hypothetical protein
VNPETGFTEAGELDAGKQVTRQPDAAVVIAQAVFKVEGS